MAYKPQIRICNWNRQTGKTSFIVNDVIEQSKNPDTLCIVVTPAESHVSNIMRQLTLAKKPTEFNFNILVQTDNTFVNFTKPLGKHYKTLRIYFDEVTDMYISYEQIMQTCCKLSERLIFGDYSLNTMLTFTMTKPKKPDILEQLSTQIRKNSDWLDF